MGLNVLGNKLQPCCTNPVTGYFRAAYCRTLKKNIDTHVAPVVVLESSLLKALEYASLGVLKRCEAIF